MRRLMSLRTASLGQDSAEKVCDGYADFRRCRMVRADQHWTAGRGDGEFIPNSQAFRVGATLDDDCIAKCRLSNSHGQRAVWVRLRAFSGHVGTAIDVERVRVACADKQEKNCTDTSQQHQLRYPCTPEHWDLSYHRNLQLVSKTRISVLAFSARTALADPRSRCNGFLPSCRVQPTLQARPGGIVKLTHDSLRQPQDMGYKGKPERSIWWRPPAKIS